MPSSNNVVISGNMGFNIKILEIVIENLIKLIGNGDCNINIIESHHINKISVTSIY